MLNQILTQSRASMKETSNPRQLRTAIYKGIASLLWSQYSLENNIARIPFEHAPANVKAQLLDHAEVLANMFLSPDLQDTALMCAADAIARSTYEGSFTISELSRPIQQSYLNTAEHAIQNYFLNLRTVAPDARYRDAMCSLVDSVVPKTNVQ